MAARFLRVVRVFYSDKGLWEARVPPDRWPQVVSSVTFEGSSTCIAIFEVVIARVFAILSDRKRGNTSDGNGSGPSENAKLLGFQASLYPSRGVAKPM